MSRGSLEEEVDVILTYPPLNVIYNRSIDHSYHCIFTKDDMSYFVELES